MQASWEAIKGLQGHLKKSHGWEKKDCQPYLNYFTGPQLQLAKSKDISAEQIHP